MERQAAANLEVAARGAGAKLDCCAPLALQCAEPGWQGKSGFCCLTQADKLEAAAAGAGRQACLQHVGCTAGRTNLICDQHGMGSAKGCRGSGMMQLSKRQCLLGQVVHLACSSVLGVHGATKGWPGCAGCCQAQAADGVTGCS